MDQPDPRRVSRMVAYARLRVMVICHVAALAGCVKGDITYMDKAGRERQFQPLAARTLETDSYELVPISTRRIGGPAYIPSRQEFLVVNPTTIARYSLSGELLDIMSRQGRFDEHVNDAAVAFGPSHYNDWILTSDPEDKPYEPLDASLLTPALLSALLAEAEDFSCGSFYDEFVYLKRAGRWQRLPAELPGKSWDCKARRPLRGGTWPSAQIIWPEAEPWSVDQQEGPLALVDFKTTLKHRAPLLLNFHGSSNYREGIGRLRWEHHGESFYLRLTIRRRGLFGSGPYDLPLTFFQAPGAQQGAKSAVFVEADTLPPLHGEQWGLYVLRPKQRNRATNMTPYQVRHPFAVTIAVVEGAQTASLERLEYFDDSREEIQEGPQTLTAAQRPLPSSLFFAWPQPEHPTGELDRLIANGALSWWEDDGTIGLSFEAFELRRAVALLGDEAPITFQVELDSFQGFQEARVFISGGDRRIELSKVVPITKRHGLAVPVKAVDAHQLTLAKLDTLLQRATASATWVQPLVAFASGLPAAVFREGTSRRADDFANLINAQVRRGNLRDAQSCFALFIAKLRPGLSEAELPALEHIAADMLNFHRQDSTVWEMVSQQCFGADKTFAQLKNPRLLFNLACYYGYKRDKKAMLGFAERALKLGHATQPFRNDQDLAAFRHDPDLAALLVTYEQEGPAPAGSK